LATTPVTSTRPDRQLLRRRLLPLYAAVFLQNLALWVPIEKLFMTSIGFNPASIGAMAAVYAVVVPVLEVPSGVLADRWSRRGVLVLASIAAIISVLIGGLSQSVAVYMVSAAFLGVFFALQSGTLESVVYDTVLEETGAVMGSRRPLVGSGSWRASRWLQARWLAARSPPSRRCGARTS
jgi:MFS family permease